MFRCVLFRSKGFCERYNKRIIALIISIVLLFFLRNGYTLDFLQLTSTILSIFIGLFITAIIFALDKFYHSERSRKYDYKINLSENDKAKNFDVCIDEVRNTNSKDTLWYKRSYYYVQQFILITGKNIVISVFALAAICINTLFINDLSIDLFDYEFVKITLSSIINCIFLILVVFLRISISFLIVEIFYNTISIVSSMVNFMFAKLKREYN